MSDNLLNTEIDTTEPFYVRYFTMDGILHMDDDRGGLYSLTRKGIGPATAEARRFNDLIGTAASIDVSDLPPVSPTETVTVFTHEEVERREKERAEYVMLVPKWRYLGAVCDLKSYSEGRYTG